MGSVFAILECYCDDEGDRVIGVFGSRADAEAVRTAEIERHARFKAVDTKPGVSLDAARSRWGRMLRIEEFPIGQIVPEAARNPPLSDED